MYNFSTALSMAAPFLTKFKYFRFYGHLSMEMAICTMIGGQPPPRYFPKELRVLELRHNCPSDQHCMDTRVLLRALVAQAPQLEVLCVDECIDNECFVHLPLLTRLSYLDICLKTHQTAQTLEEYSATLRQLPQLRGIALNIDRGVWSGGASNPYNIALSWQLIGRTVEAAPQLEHLSTPRFVSAWSQEADWAMERLTAMTRLRSLELSVEVPVVALEVVLSTLADTGVLEVGACCLPWKWLFLTSFLAPLHQSGLFQ